ncbi:MAG: hypothetical protein IKM81_10610 [Fibrobacter sp.]|nr:hypothetical protein [Fibrobacter sp.]
MKKLYIAFVVVFAVMLLLPFSAQTIADLRGEKRFVSLDIFKDVVYTPFKRESKMAESAAKLNEAWFAARESMAGGGEVGEALEPVVGALSDLEAVVLSVNSYAELDSAESDYKLLKLADTLVAALEDEPESFKTVDSTLKAVVAEFGHFSLWRALCGIKHYGVWTSRYLRAFEKKVEDENVLVLKFRPQYQLAVWNVFNEPGEKVVLGAGEGRWLFYRQDVEFLVQPSPLDVRSAKLDNPIQAILKFREQLKKKGVELLVVITPGKPSIYPERLTGASGEKPIASHGKAILDSLTKLGLNTVDLYTPLLAAKANDANLGELYLNDDTHWTPRGAELAAGEIAKKVNSMVNAGLIDIGEPSVDYEVTDSLADRMGDIGEMSGLNKFNVFKVQQVTGHVVSPFKDDFRKSKILILGDSFSRIYQTDAPVNAGWIAHFARNISRPVSSIVSDGGASTLVREKLARKAGVLKGKKLLIWEFVERDLRFGAEGWKTIEF